MSVRRHKGISRLYLAIVMLFLYLPILVLIVYSFNQNKSRGAWTGFTLDWYKKLFTNQMILSAFANTLIVALVSSVAATVVGTAAAIGINSMNKWMKKSIRTLTYIPIMSPEIIMGVSLMMLFVFARTKIGIPLEMGLTTLILAHITFNIMSFSMFCPSSDRWTSMPMMRRWTWDAIPSRPFTRWLSRKFCRALRPAFSWR